MYGKYMNYSNKINDARYALMDTHPTDVDKELWEEFSSIYNEIIITELNILDLAFRGGILYDDICKEMDEHIKLTEELFTANECHGLERLLGRRPDVTLKISLDEDIINSLKSLHGGRYARYEELKSKLKK